MLRHQLKVSWDWLPAHLLTLPRRAAQQEHKKRLSAQSPSLPVAISRATSPSMEASAAAVSANAGSPPRCADLSAPLQIQALELAPHGDTFRAHDLL